MGKKEKKEKVRYYDDGRTIADMSGIGGRRLGDNNPMRPRSSAKERWQTYWTAVRMMFRPMLVVIGGLCVLYLIAYFIFGFLM